MQTPQTPSSNRRNTLLSYLVLLLIAGTVFATDQIVKSIIVDTLAFGESWAPFPWMGRLVQFTYITNTGAAFGFFTDGGIFFVVVAVLVAVFIIYYYPQVTSWILRVCLGLMFGGAVGNLWDRIFNDGHVVDYIDIGFWPIFNIADMSIVFGVTIMAVWLWQEEEELSA